MKIENDTTELREQVDGWIKPTRVRYFSELTNLGILTEKVGELARVMVVNLWWAIV